MERQLTQWKLAVDRLWSAHTLDLREAARLVAEIAGCDEAMLRQAAAQALPSLRNAMLKGADRSTRDLARRRLGLVRDALHVQTAPRFGKRGVTTALTPEQRHRQLLGLPMGRRLASAEIQTAFKRVAKTAHPDGGGNGQVFGELSAARDALLKGR
jgi:hypothetical protein